MQYDIYKLIDQYHLNEIEQKLLQELIHSISENKQYSVRELAVKYYVSPATVMRLSKKMGYSGYTDMVYRLKFLMRHQKPEKAPASNITSFIGNIPQQDIDTFIQLLLGSRKDPILVSGTGFCMPIREFVVRKLLVLGFQAIGTNSYELYEKNAFHCKICIVISKSGATESILKPVRDGLRNDIKVISVTGNRTSPLAQDSTLTFELLDDEIMDDRNLTANYFYARTLILFEYLFDLGIKEYKRTNDLLL